MEPLNSYTSKTVYIFMSHLPDGHSLFGLDILMPPKEEGDWVVQSPVPLHYFPPINHRRNMACGKLGSKLYILGGISWLGYPEEEELFIPWLDDPEGQSIVEFPRDVQVFDPADPKKLTEVEQMNFGKFAPLMFEVKGKLYVLGSPGFFDDVYLAKLKMFEEYDPTTNQWKVLDDPPVEDEKYYRWEYCFVVNPSRVIFQGTIRNVFFIFNPTTSTWSRLKRPDYLYFGDNALFVEDSIYGSDVGGYFIKAGPFPSSTLEDDDNLVGANLSCEFSKLDWGDKDPDSTPFLCPVVMPEASRPMICHLGNGLFCLLETSSVFSKYGRIPDQRYFNVYINKDLQRAKGGFEAKCLHAATFIISVEFHNICYFDSCHVMSNETQQDVTRSESCQDVKRRKI